jgi:hypothetical protein
MIVEYLDTIDWEPLFLHFEFEDEPYFESLTIEKAISCAFARTKASCFCHLVHQSGKWLEPSIYLYKVEWACRRCLDETLRGIGGKITSLRRVRVGLPCTTVVDDPREDLIDIPEKVIVVEDGRNVHVPAFKVQRSPVTVGQFREFSKVTGYLSVAERIQSEETYLRNPTLAGPSENARMACYGRFFAPEDAFAFCNHYKMRLLDEAEWLSAAVYDWEEYDLSNPEIAIALASRKRPEQCIQVVACDFTRSVEQDRIVGRSGPARFLEKNWRTRGYRRFFDLDEFSLETGFRVAAIP